MYRLHREGVDVLTDADSMLNCKNDTVMVEKVDDVMCKVCVTKIDVYIRRAFFRTWTFFLFPRAWFLPRSERFSFSLSPSCVDINAPFGAVRCHVVGFHLGHSRAAASRSTHETFGSLTGEVRSDQLVGGSSETQMGRVWYRVALEACEPQSSLDVRRTLAFLKVEG